MTTHQLDLIGKANYDAYCESRKWMSFRGEALPHWEDCPEDIRIGWRNGAVAVVEVNGFLRAEGLEIQ